MRRPPAGWLPSVQSEGEVLYGRRGTVEVQQGSDVLASIWQDLPQVCSGRAWPYSRVAQATKTDDGKDYHSSG